MSKKKAPEENASAAPAAPEPQLPGSGSWTVPKWALIAGAIMLAAGSFAFARKDRSERDGLIKAMNDARVKVDDEANGLERGFGETNLETSQKEFLKVLGAISKRPALAQDIFRTVIGNGTTQGRILACRMAPHLAHANLLEEADVKAIVKQLDSKEEAPLRRAAQDALSWVLAIADPVKGKQLETLKAKPANPKEKWQAKTFDSEFFGQKFLIVRWSTPDACAAWFEEHAGQMKWDNHLKRYAIGEAPKPETAVAPTAPAQPGT